MSSPINPDDLRRLLAATPGEPDLPTDPVAAVHTRARVIRARRRGAAGALAVAVLAAVAGTALALPGGGTAGGESRLHVAAPTTTDSPTTTTTPTPTTSATTTAPAVAASSTATAPGLPFTWSVSVSGDQVTVGGSWSGTAPTVSASALAADPQSSTFAEAGSGVLGIGGYVTNADGSQVLTGELGAAVPDGSVYDSNGDLPSCTGPAVAQHRVIPPKTVTISRPGSYRLVMHSITCAGVRDDAVPFTVGAGLTFAWDVHVYGDLAQVGGTWSGRSSVMTAMNDDFGDVIAQQPGAPAAVVGHLDLDAGGGTVQPIPYGSRDQVFGYPLSTFTDRPGSFPICGGATQQRSESIAQPYWVRFPHAGTYTLTMRSLTCTGEVDSTTTVSVGGSDPFHVTITPSTSTAPSGSAVTYTAVVTGPATGMQLQFATFAPKGDYSAMVQRPTPAGSAGCVPSGSTQTVTETFTGPMPTSESGPWRVEADLVCDPSVTRMYDSDGSVFVFDTASTTVDVAAASSSPAPGASTSPGSVGGAAARRED